MRRLVNRRGLRYREGMMIEGPHSETGASGRPGEQTAGPASEIDAARLRDHFLGWQCRVRQHAVRRHGGRPQPGMRPRVLRADGSEIAEAVTVVLAEAEPEATTATFRHIVRRTHDPAKRYADALGFLAAAYFQYPRNFDDRVAAVFPFDSPLAAALVAERACVLEYAQFNQRYRIPCTIAALAVEDPLYQATYWHNAMFNAAMPGVVRILAFTPDWREAAAYPPV